MSSKALAVALLLTAAPALASDVARVQADGAAPLPAYVPGKPRPAAPTADELKALRQAAVANGLDQAVLAYASRLAREEVRADEAVLRAALGGDKLAELTLGHGVVADLGVREVVPKLAPGELRPARRASEPVPMEHAWRLEVLVDGDRVLAALRVAGLAFASGDATATGTAVTIAVAAPYDAAGLAALRARLVSLGAASVVPRRYAAEEVLLEVRGLAADVLVGRLATEPPAGYVVEAEISESDASALRVRLTLASGAAAVRQAPAAQPASD